MRTVLTNLHDDPVFLEAKQTLRREESRFDTIRSALRAAQQELEGKVESAAQILLEAADSEGQTAVGLNPAMAAEVAAAQASVVVLEKADAVQRIIADRARKQVALGPPLTFVTVREKSDPPWEKADIYPDYSSSSRPRVV